MKKKFLKIAIITMMLIFVYATVVSALSFTATMTPSSTTVAESTEFTISVKVSNLDVGPNGINTLSGYLKYDQDVFEDISDSSIEGLNGWSATYNAESGKITLTKTTFVKAEEQVFQITFKTKAGTSDKSGAIHFNNILASNSESEISASDISTTITVGTTGGNTGNTTNSNTNSDIKAEVTPGNKTNTNSNTNKNTNTNSNTNNPISSYTNKTNTSEEDIPYTGVEDTVLYLLIAVIVVAIVSYIKFEKVNKEIK